MYSIDLNNSLEFFIDFSKKEDKEKLWKYLRTLNKPYRIFIDAETRRKNYNRYYWGVVIEIIHQYTGHDKVELHEYFKYKFNSIFIGDGRKRKEIEGSSTATLSQKDFELYLFHVKKFFNEFTNYEVIIPEIWEIQQAKIV